MMQKVFLKPYYQKYLGPVLFNIFINDLFLFINKAKILETITESMQIVQKWKRY